MTTISWFANGTNRVARLIPESPAPHRVPPHPHQATLGGGGDAAAGAGYVERVE